MNPVVNPAANLGVSLFDETDPVYLWESASEADIEIVIRAVYRQILGNAHIMESERLAVPESQLRQREFTVREFVRQVAKSELYRSRFFDPCSRYRAIELNFKHLLGRAPHHFEEMRHHSAILDQAGFAADIDSYIDSDEYQTAFGENIVPYCRGYKTQAGQPMLEFTNMLQLLGGACSSDKDLTSGNKARLTRALILNRAYGIEPSRSGNDILSEVFGSGAQPSTTLPFSQPSSGAEYALQQKYQEQATLVAALQSQLAELRPFASMGSAIIRQDQFAGDTSIAPLTSSGIRVAPAGSTLQRQVEEQEALIASLQEQLAEARSLAAIGEARLNKWRRRTFF
ncbi:hypothetical protein BST81_06230 [Leptolyngbya sp. 'hensonii']|nr:hypothetical protein BST81_06230 [Leptolyngbya sp. 'hensonii']